MKNIKKDGKIGQFLLNIRKSNNIIRYNNEDYIKKNTYMEHSTNVAHIAYFLAKEEEELGKVIDWKLLILRIIFGNTLKAELGDISYILQKELNDERDYVLEMKELIFEKNKTYMPSSWTDDLKSYMIGSDSILVEQLYEASRIIERIMEARQELKYINPKYSDPYCQNILEYRNQLMETGLPSAIRFAKEEIDQLEIFGGKIGNITKVLDQFRKIQNIDRYSNSDSLNTNSVSAHTTNVAILSFVLARWEEYKFGHTINWKELMLRAVFHDALESVTGDVLGPTKGLVDGFKEALEAIEGKMFDSKIKKFLRPEHEDLYRYILKPKDDTIEGYVIDSADKLDTVFEVRSMLYFTNVALNDEYIIMLNNQLERLLAMKNKSTKYFLRYPFEDLGLMDYVQDDILLRLKEVDIFSEIDFTNKRSIYKEGLDKG